MFGHANVSVCTSACMEYVSTNFMLIQPVVGSCVVSAGAIRSNVDCQSLPVLYVFSLRELRNRKQNGCP